MITVKYKDGTTCGFRKEGRKLVREFVNMGDGTSGDWCFDAANPVISFDYAILDKLDLSDLNLAGIRFEAASMAGTNLRKTNLRGAVLVGAYLECACLESADLSGCYAIGSTLVKANCRNANFSGATLTGANMLEADLGGATFNGAQMRGTSYNGYLQTMQYVDNKPKRDKYEITPDAAERSRIYALLHVNDTNQKASELQAIIREGEVMWKLAENFNFFTDPRDGRTYKTVKIGKQVWMAENLAFDYKGSYCYDNKLENAKKYGRLYNWETAMKVAPPGWHLPSDEEWKELTEYLGGKDKAGEKLKAANAWNDDSTNEVGFSALPGGYRSTDGSFYYVGDNGFWWSSSPGEFSYAWLRYLDTGDSALIRSSNSRQTGFSVRLVKD